MSRSLYVVGCTGVQAVKIGSATDCISRLCSLQTGCPLPLALLWTHETARAFAIESALHRRFRAQWVRGEWFDLGLDAVPTVKAALCEELPRILKEETEGPAPALLAEPEIPPILKAVLKVWPAQVARLAPQQLADLLDGSESHQYPGLTPAELNSRMGSIGLSAAPLRIGGKVLRGYDHAKLMTAAAAC